MEFIVISNNGQDIKDTNYFDMEHAKQGLVYLSSNAGAIRMLLPKSKIYILDEVRTSEHVVISRGPFPAIGKHDFIEVMFEDYSDTPYVIHSDIEQCDFRISNKDVGVQFEFSIWTEDGKQLTMPCVTRTSNKLPCMKAFPKEKWKSRV